MKEELVSVIIVNYNGKDYLLNCLRSIRTNLYKNFEIIIVDNNSSDGSVDFVKQKLRGINKKVSFIVLKDNFGPAFARNRGAEIARGKYLAFLDNDTEVEKNWIKEALKLFTDNQDIGCLQCKLLLLKNKKCYDYAGEYLNQYGFLSHRANYQEIDHGQYDWKVEILAAKSAGMFIRRDVFNEIGGFDEDYFIYLEETDLGWRSWLSGYKTVFCPKSIVYHEFSSSLQILGIRKTMFNLRFHGTKNYLSTLIKNLEFKSLITILPKHLLIWLSLVVILFVVNGQPKDSFWIIKGIFWNLKNIENVLGKRRVVQRDRVISDRDLFEKILKRQKIAEKVRQFLFAQKFLKKIYQNA